MPTRLESATCVCQKCGHEPGMKDTTLAALVHLDFPRQPSYQPPRTIGDYYPAIYGPGYLISAALDTRVQLSAALLWTCAVCGYQWTTPCADADV